MANEVDKSAVIHQMHGKPLSPDQLETEETVTMFFPRRVLLTLNDHRRVEFGAGVQEVPVDLAEHKYLALNGVRKHDGKKKDLKPPVNVELGEEHVKYLQEQGVPITSEEQANKYFGNLLPEQRERFLTEFAAWKEKDGKQTIFSSPSGSEQQTGDDQGQQSNDQENGQDQQSGKSSKKRQPATKAS